MPQLDITLPSKIMIIPPKLYLKLQDIPKYVISNKPFSLKFDIIDKPTSEVLDKTFFKTYTIKAVGKTAFNKFAKSKLKGKRTFSGKANNIVMNNLVISGAGIHSVTISAIIPNINKEVMKITTPPIPCLNSNSAGGDQLVSGATRMKVTSTATAIRKLSSPGYRSMFINRLVNRMQILISNAIFEDMTIDGTTIKFKMTAVDGKLTAAGGRICKLIKSAKKFILPVKSSKQKIDKFKMSSISVGKYNCK